jgi:hypothetical protein
MLQAAVLDGVAFDPFSVQQDGLPPPEVDIGGREVLQALVIAVVVVVFDEPADAGFEIARQVIVFEQLYSHYMITYSHNSALISLSAMVSLDSFEEFLGPR